MVTGRDTFPSVSVGIGGSQKVDLRSPRPALICVPRGSGIAFHRAGTGERAPRGRAHVYDAGRAGIAGLQSGTSLNSFSLVRVVMSNPPAGRSHWIRSSTRPRATMWWLDLAYAPHLRPERRRRLLALDAPRCLFC
jgi:hypothetical protein